MGELNISPISRMAMPGSTTYFKVCVNDREASTIRVVPCEEAEQYKAEFAGGGTETPANQGELTLAIAVPARAEMA